MKLNALGEVAQAQWLGLESRYPQIKCHAHQIMPNHMHGILELHNSVKSELQLSQVIGAYKSLTHKYGRAFFLEKKLAKLWQPNFYEHVIRNDKAFQAITEYIETNPAQWDKDKYFIE
nr:transposase [Marinicella rhabdoformis]